MKLNLTATNKQEELILAYLEENASETLADKINNGTPYEKDGKPLINKKTLSGFMKYACDEARKLAEKGANSACVDDTIVYGWAIHYFEEESIEGTFYTIDGEEYKPASTVKKATQKSVNKPVIKEKPKQQLQFSLFDQLDTAEDKTEETTPIVDDETTEDFTDEEKEEVFATINKEETKPKISPMIFCVEDDCSIRDLVIYTLNSAGFEARGVEDGEALFSELKQETPELIMLDIMLPGEDGITILKKLRQNPVTSDIPVIMATAKGTEYDKVIGLDLGADDYLAKPFGMMEMVSRVKAVLRRAVAKPSSQLLHMGNLEINTSNHIVSACGKRVELTLKEYEMLHLFMENPGRAFTRDQIFSAVWGADCIFESRTVDVHIGTLRSKIGECGSYIETVRGVGYRMEVRI